MMFLGLWAAGKENDDIAAASVHRDTDDAAASPAVSLGLPPLDVMGPCKHNERHRVKAKTRKDNPQYQLFQAASDGCLRCVRRKLEIEKEADAHKLSDTNKWSVKDFARWGTTLDNAAGAAEVLTYLQERWPTVPETRK